MVLFLVLFGGVSDECVDVVVCDVKFNVVLIIFVIMGDVVLCVMLLFGIVSLLMVVVD